MQYAAELDRNRRRRAIVVLVSDLYEGGSPSHLLALTQPLVAQGTRVLALAALDEAPSRRSTARSARRWSNAAPKSVR